MGYKRVKIDEFEKAVEQTMLQFGRDKADGSVKLVKNIAKQCAEDVGTAIERAGINGDKYRNSIAVRNEGGRNKGKSIIWSPEHYRLTHLLEHGHAIVIKGKSIGRKTDARPHWAEAEKVAIDRLNKGLRELYNK